MLIVYMGYSLFLIHSLFWLLNGHFWSLIAKTGLIKIHNEKFKEFSITLIDDIRKRNFLIGAIIVGSISRSETLSYSSDLDIRLIRKKNLINALQSVFYCFYIRFKSFLNFFPIDIYVEDIENLKYKIRKDEIPIIIVDPYDIIKRFYNYKYYTLDYFLKNISK